MQLVHVVNLVYVLCLMFWGPLTNPAGAKRQVMGVFSNDWLVTLATVLKNLGSEQVMIVHSDDGMDEISISAPTNIAELKNGEISTYKIEPEQFNIQRTDISALAVESVDDSLKVMYAVWIIRMAQLGISFC